jgi:hypothetical protein
MKTHFLLPRYFKYIGIVLTVISILWELLEDFQTKDISLRIPVIYEDGNWFTIIKNDFSDEIWTILTLLGLYFIAFAKEKIEDEMINNIRLRSVMIAIICQIVLQILAELLLFQNEYITFFTYERFTILPIYIIVFQAYKLKIKLSHEE